MKTIGQRIKDLRLEAGMTQDELAHKVGYKSRASINKIELCRKMPIDKLEKIADALGTTPTYLMGWETRAEDQRQEALKLVENPHLQRLILFAGENIPTEDVDKYVDALIGTIEALNKANKKAP